MILLTICIITAATSVLSQSQDQKENNFCKAESSTFLLTGEIKNLTQKLCQDKIAYFLPGEENFEFLVANNGVPDFQKPPFIQPLIVILPKNEQEVAKIINLIKYLNLPIGIRNGGHSNWGLVNPPGGIVICMNNFNQIEIDEQKQIIQIGGGVKMQELNDALNGTGLWLPIAGGPTVGYTGFLLHGGIDRYYCKFLGLASDLLLGATIVLSSGEIIEANENNNAELFYAIKGAGSIFGVVTKLTVQLIDVQNYSHDYFVYPFSEETMKQSIIFVKNISQRFSDVQVSSYFLHTGNEMDAIQITIAYNNTDNKLRQSVSKQLQNNMQVEFLEIQQNLQPYQHLNLNDKLWAPYNNFVISLFFNFPQVASYSQGFKYNYLTDENLDKIINIYHKNQFLQKELKNKKWGKVGMFHSLGGKIGESKSLTVLKNVEIFSHFTDLFEPYESELFQQNFESIKQFGRSQDGIFADIYTNGDVFPIPNNFSNEIMADFVGGEHNFNKIVELKHKYDPKNIFTGNYFQQVFQD